MRPIPTLSEIYSGFSNDLKSKLGLPDDELRKVLDAFAAVESAQIKLIYLRLADVLNNLFPDTADLAINGGELERIGNIYLNRPPNPATAGIYDCTVSGEIGSIIKSGITFKSNDDSKNPGILFVVDTELIFASTSETISLRSLTPGTEALLETGNELTITQPVIGVDNIAAVTSITQEPRAAESTQSYRQAVLDAIQLEPQGGARTDYRIWAADAQGVRKVYPYVKESESGTVQVYVEATKEDSTDGLGTPSAGLLSDVLDVIELDPDVTKSIEERGRRPIQATVETLSILVNPVDVNIIGLNTSTTEIESAVQIAIENYLDKIRPYIPGADLARNKNDTLYAARMQSAVGDVLSSSNFFTGFVMSVNGVEANSSIFSRQNIPYLRSLIFS